MTSEQKKLTSDELGSAFRNLAEEYTGGSEELNEATFSAIEAKMEGRPPSQMGSGVQRSRKPIVLSLAAAAAVALAVWGTGSISSEDELAYSVAGSVEHVLSRRGTGDVVASEADPVLIKFTDDTRVTLEPHSTIRLQADASGKNITARFSHGRAVVVLPEAQEAEVQIQAGAFELRPLSASFSFAYSPGTEVLEVAPERGVVLVRDAEGAQHRVGAGEKLTLPRVEEKRVGKEVEAPSTRPRGTPDAKTSAPPKSSPANRTSFKDLAAQGKFAAIVSQAKQRGIAQVLSTESPAELQELGQAARYTGDLALAARTWKQMTQRFSGASGKNAHFFLGRLEEGQGNLSAALNHYGAYLRGGSSGVYTAEALGRKLSIVEKSQGVQQARPIAQEYLRRFPQGPYARAARELVGGE